jgi:hypothetical protein
VKDDLLKHLGTGAKNAITHFCGTPAKSADFYNHLSKTRAAIRVGTEVMELGMSRAPGPDRDRALNAIACGLAVVSALEMCMSVVESLYPEETGKASAAPPGDSTAPMSEDEHRHIVERFKRLDLG